MEMNGKKAGKRIDPADFSPAYYQLAQILRGKIMGGELHPGDRIPSEEELGEEYGLSRMTVRRAIATLSEEGLLRGERGRGTFVVEPKVDGGLFLIPDFHEEMRNRGISTRVRLLGVKAVRAKEPLVFDRKYILYDKTQPLLEEELGHGSTTELFSGSSELRPVRAELNLTATILSAREAELLASREGAPAFCMEQLLYAANDLRVVWGLMNYRGDRFSFASLSRPL